MSPVLYQLSYRGIHRERKTAFFSRGLSFPLSGAAPAREPARPALRHAFLNDQVFLTLGIMQEYLDWKKRSNLDSVFFYFLREGRIFVFQMLIPLRV